MILAVQCEYFVITSKSLYSQIQSILDSKHLRNLLLYILSQNQQINRIVTSRKSSSIISSIVQFNGQLSLHYNFDSSMIKLLITCFSLNLKVVIFIFVIFIFAILLIIVCYFIFYLSTSSVEGRTIIAHLDSNTSLRICCSFNYFSL